MRSALTLFLAFFLVFKSFSQNKSESVLGYIKVYQKYISGIRGGQCPMYPSCSRFGYESFSKNGFGKGIIDTADRLIRCGHDHNNYTVDITDFGLKLIDPVKTPSFSYQSLVKNESGRVYPYNDTLKDNTQQLLIRDLMLNRFYQEALIELKRLMLSADSISSQTFINYMKCLLMLDRQEDAIYQFELMGQKFRSGYLYLQMAEIWKSLNNWEKEIEFLKLAHEEFQNDEVEYHKISLLKGVSFAMDRKYDEAIDTFENIPLGSSYHNFAEYRINLTEDLKNIKLKSPTAGALLGLVPGLGYLYAGHKQSALSALLVNGLLFYATYTSAINDNYGMAALTGAFSLTFYISGISGSAQSVKRRNEIKKVSKLNKINFNY